MTNKIDIKELRETLNQDAVLVQFTKVDGTIRDMNCTTCPDLIPEDKMPNNVVSNSTKAVNDKVLRVFDLTINEWRSFRTETLINVTL